MTGHFSQRRAIVKPLLRLTTTSVLACAALCLALSDASAKNDDALNPDRLKAIALMLPDAPAGVGRPMADRAGWDALAAAAFSGLHSATKFAAQAGALVAVVSRKGKFSAWLGNQVQDTNFRLVDIGIAAEHFVLAAEEQGLGTCWLGWFDAKGAAKALGLPAGCKAEIMLSVGYADEAPSARRKKTIEEISSFNRY